MSAPPTSSSVCLVLLFLLGGCEAAPADMREWTPGDHNHTSESGAEQKGQTTGKEAPNPLGLDQVTLSTWQNNCISCHGKLGRGDGPQAFLYKPRDLTDPTWQASVPDEQLVAAIQNGKGKMPGFALPDATALGLVKLVRLLGNLGARTQGAHPPVVTRTPGPTDTPAAATGASAPTPPSAHAPTTPRTDSTPGAAAESP